MNFLRKRLDQLLVKLNLEISEDQRNQLFDYVKLLNKWNQVYNLTSVRDPMEMLTKHILDSLSVNTYLKGERLIDVGTGPGLPGIPLAIINPNKEFVLLDSLGKRIRFVQQVQYELSIKNVVPIKSCVKEFQPEERFDGVLSRAFASMSRMVEWCYHLPKLDSGVFLALKGQLPRDEILALPTWCSVVDINFLEIPELEGDRHLVILSRKV
ncbi:ribosomal RNA small subunit methyltransferase G [Candidatus Photodesmus blepharus]|uniref:Ribosomal RNA small subunit methyltransferase G n=1 Tax=Candidatus Photodesmus blepharonis TaxID=1179155 RepID=A0A084CNP3_9GAMM|nr:16S rRNA (guanine(527)-N(7))-methyltransferase RsmG [Candidatus Photodesmus blepharus]KEY91422.1 ribosomal RNA small subunit methyltransferase G [Candidatus Photodesmus blepharus]